MSLWYSSCTLDNDLKLLLALILLSGSGAMGLPLGVTFSEWLNFPASGGAQIAIDGSGSIYFLTGSTVTKLTTDGKTIVWQNQLGFAVSAMAVDPNGGVYVAPVTQQNDSSAYVAKLSATGSGLAWKMAVGFFPQSPPALAADSQGRVYFAAQSIVNNFVTRTANVIRLNAAGTAVDYTAQVMGTPASIAIDPSGSALIAGSAVSTQGVTMGFLAKVAPDGSSGFYSVFPAGLSNMVAVDSNGNVVVFGAGVVQRVDATGAVTVKTDVGLRAGVSFALDAAGNAYVTLVTNQLYHVKSSLASCRFDPSTNMYGYSELLTVIAPDGSITQTTYIPGGDNLGSPDCAPLVRIPLSWLQQPRAPASRPRRPAHSRREPRAVSFCRASRPIPASRLTPWHVRPTPPAFRSASSRRVCS